MYTIAKTLCRSILCQFKYIFLIHSLIFHVSVFSLNNDTTFNQAYYLFLQWFISLQQNLPVCTHSTPQDKWVKSKTIYINTVTWKVRCNFPPIPTWNMRIKMQLDEKEQGVLYVKSFAWQSNKFLVVNIILWVEPVCRSGLFANKSYFTK